MSYYKCQYIIVTTSFINSSISLSVGFRPIARIAHPNSWLVSKIIQHLHPLIIMNIYLILSIINQLFNQSVNKIIEQSWLLIIIVNKIINQFLLLIIVNNDRLLQP